MAARATSVAPAASGLAAPRRRVVVSRRTPPPRPRPRPVVVAAAATEEVPLGTQIETALLGAFPPGTVDRVRDSLRFTLADGVHEVNHPGLGLQQASSYIAGLTPRPYWDVRGGDFPWLVELEKNFETIRDELREGLANPDLERLGNAIWVAAARDDAEGYGPDWRTLVLQDRCEWEPTNVGLFPKTTALVKAANAPSVEVFFAKQAPKTGIKPHTDFTNFIMTAHLGLDCPPPPLSWMKVGEETKHWEDGVGMAADTSFIHSTYNDSEDRDRFVLIVRFWHPELTAHERDGVRFLFDAFEDLSPAGLAAAAGKARARVASRESADEHGRSGSGADEADAAAAFKSAVSAKVSAPQSGEEEEENGTRGGGGRRKKGRKKKAKGGGGKGLGLLAKGMK